MSNKMPDISNENPSAHYQLHVVEHKKNAPKIVFLHGLGGTHRYWLSGLDRLRLHYHVILVDLLGFGDSDKPWTNYSKERHILALEQTLAHLDHFLLVGHSMGAALSLAYTARSPHQVLGQILISLPYFTSKNKAFQWYRRTPSGWLMTNMLTAIITCIVTRRVVGKFLPRLLKHYPKEIAEDLLKHTFLSSTTSLWQVLYQSTLPSDVAKLPDNISTLCIHSRDDDSAQYETIASLVDEHRQWQLITLNNSKHHPWLWDNNTCVNAVISVMQDLAGEV
jgi:pimeloyl-ACP methyl ester carboxylesterase